MSICAQEFFYAEKREIEKDLQRNDHLDYFRDFVSRNVLESEVITLQFAYVPYFEGWKMTFPSGTEENYGDKKYIRLDSMTIEKETEAKYIKGKKAQYIAECLVCGERLSFNIGSRKKNLGRNSYFFHPSREKCHSYESVAHGSTKRHLYDLFKDAGYVVKEEHRHSKNGQNVRADVAVLRTDDGGEKLQLAIEVQASDIRISNIQRRINVYYDENAPTAWVLVLDSFFPPRDIGENGEIVDRRDGYHGTRKSSFNKETKTYDVKYISTTEENDFFVVGKNNKAFNYLMDVYDVIVAVDHKGKFFLIRRTEESAKERALAIARGQGDKHTTQDGHYVVNRVAKHDIVPVLLETKIIQAPDEGNEGSVLHQISGTFKGDTHKSEIESRKMIDSTIDFNGQEETSNYLDSLLLARQAREAVQKELIKARLQIEEEEKEAKRLREEELAKKIEQEYLSNLHSFYEKELDVLYERLEGEKEKFPLNTISGWMDWLRKLSIEKEGWVSCTNELFRRFSDRQEMGELDFEEYREIQNEQFKRWIEYKDRDLEGFIIELRAYHEQQRKYKSVAVKEFNYIKSVLHKRESKFKKMLLEKRRIEEEKRIQEEIERKKEEQRIREEERRIKRQEQIRRAETKRKQEEERIEAQRQEQIRREEEKQKEQEERIKIQKQKELYQFHCDLLTKEIDELEYVSESSVISFREKFWGKYISIDPHERTTFENKYFIGGLPIWFASRKFKLEDREFKALKSQKKKDKSLQDKRIEKRTMEDWQQANLL